MSKIKEVAKAMLTDIVDDIEDQYGASTFVDGERIIKRIERVIDYLVDMPEEDEPKQVEPDISEIADLFGPEELLDVLADMKKVMSQDSKDFLLQRFMRGGK